MQLCKQHKRIIEFHDAFELCRISDFSVSALRTFKRKRERGWFRLFVIVAFEKFWS